MNNAVWITAPQATESPGRVFSFRKSFVLKEHPVSAVWTLTARGIVHIRVNGHDCDEQLLLPGWTDYRFRIPLRKIDISAFLVIGENHLEVLLGCGWYCGRITVGGYPDRMQYESRIPSWLGMLTLSFSNGRQQVITSSPAWLCQDNNPLLFSDFYDGERWDFTVVQTGEKNALTVPSPNAKLVETGAPPVTVIKRFHPRTLVRQDNHWIADFGINLAGRVAITATLPSGQSLVIVHGEILDENGEVYTKNLRSASGTFSAISDGLSRTYRPIMTYFGFRYAAIYGLGTLTPADLQAEFISCDMKQTGNFRCSNDLVNRLYANVITSQMGNHIDIPTDCPQRDERLGWMGDVNVFCKTALYNYDCEGFYLKYLEDVRLSQTEDGIFPQFVPFNRPEPPLESAGWTDAALTLTWELYRFYGQTRILNNMYQPLKRWFRHLKETSSNRLRNISHYGDWLNPHCAISPAFLSTAYFALAAHRMASIADILNYTDDAEEFRHEHTAIAGRFQESFLKDGHLTESGQTPAVITLAFPLLKPSQHATILQDLLNRIHTVDQCHIGTGFLGTPLLLPTLSRFGCHYTAGELLLQQDCPSWLYAISKGATSVWERWNGIQPDGSVENPRMNSFNHYALGAIAAWFYEFLCGIQPLTPGFRTVRLKPCPVPQLKSAEASFRNILSKWHFDSEGIWYWTVSLPVPGELILPNGKTHQVPPGTYQFDIRLADDTFFNCERQWKTSILFGITP